MKTFSVGTTRIKKFKKKENVKVFGRSIWRGILFDDYESIKMKQICFEKQIFF